MYKYVKSDTDIWYTTPDGREGHLFFDIENPRQDFYDLLENAFGYDFADQFRQELEGFVTDRNGERSVFESIAQENADYIMDGYNEAMELLTSGVGSALDIVNELSATADGDLKRKLEDLYDKIVNAEEALGSVAGGCNDLLEEIGLDPKY